ncbi:hypothetical protein, partial [Sabulicella rubraurantiaca]|uniref:hypothetical protein n=1 Tax=Sabulicella rubraurantiaca TaxID=2811429 RepID=UPI001A95B688
GRHRRGTPPPRAGLTGRGGSPALFKPAVFFREGGGRLSAVPAQPSGRLNCEVAFRYWFTASRHSIIKFVMTGT